MTVTVPPIVADYVHYCTLAKKGKKKETRIKNAYRRDLVWESMTTEAQWTAIDILTNNKIKYKVSTDA